MKAEKRSFWRVLLDGLCSFALRLCGVRLRTEGMDLLPDDGKYLLVSNHVSAFDPIALIHLLKKRGVTFVSKPENFRIPVCGFLMKKSGFMAIDRESPRNAIQTIYAASDILKDKGTPVVIYPEGTRNRNPEKGLLPFHNGVFKIAKRSGSPVAVGVMIGSEKASSNAFRRKTDVVFKVIEVIDAGYVMKNNDGEIGKRVRRDMESALYG